MLPTFNLDRTFDSASSSPAEGSLAAVAFKRSHLALFAPRSRLCAKQTEDEACDRGILGQFTRPWYFTPILLAAASPLAPACTFRDRAVAVKKM
jgi:hypothetical protein